MEPTLPGPSEGSGPPSQPSALRKPDTDAAPARGQGAMRAQLIIALVAGAVLVLIPLYLWNRPGTAPAAVVEAVVSSAPTAPPPDPSQQLVAAALDGGVQTESVHLGKVWVDHCERSGPGRTAPDQCDRQPFFEEALVKAVLENVSCAPKAKKGGTVSVALKVDYRREQFDVFAGKSGSLRASARGFVRCVERSMPTPHWQALPHEHSKYIIAVMATFPPQEGSP